VNQGLLLSEEESNLFCACHLLNCDEGQGQSSIIGFWYIVNGARQKKRTQPNIEPGSLDSLSDVLTITLRKLLGKVAMC
jgi:hypothetical protein